MQVGPQAGVTALAPPAAAALTPPTTASVATPASTFLLIDSAWVDDEVMTDVRSDRRVRGARRRLVEPAVEVVQEATDCLGVRGGCRADAGLAAVG